MRVVIGRYWQNSLLHDAYLFVIFVRPPCYRDRSDPNEMASAMGTTALGRLVWISNAYAICRKCEKKIELDEKSFQISYLQFTHEKSAASRNADCVIRVTVEQLRLRRY